MIFELALLGAAYFGAGKLREDGPLATRVRELTDKVVDFIAPELPAVEPAFKPAAPEAAATPPPPEPPAPARAGRQARTPTSPEQQNAVAVRTHYRNVSLFSVGALTLRNFVPLAGPLGFVTYVYGLSPHLKGVEEHLRKNRSINVDTLFLLADVLALFTGSYIAAAVSLYLIQAGKYGVVLAKDNSRKHIRNLFRDLPVTVRRVRDDGAEEEIPLAEVRRGDVLVLHAGKVIPVDGVIIEGCAGVDQQALTGEAALAEKCPGDPVLANTALMNGRVLVRVEKSGAETTASQIAEIMLKSVDYKSEAQLRGETWANALTRPMFYSSLALLPFLGPVSTSVFINSHIGMRIRILAPMSTLKYISVASRRGLLVKDGRALEKYLEVDAVLFDKTGTLTSEEPEVSQVIAASDRSIAEVVRLAAIAEQKLAHPIARAVLNKARELGVSYPDIEDSCYSIGYGIRVESGGAVIRTGSLRYLEGEGIAVPERWHRLADESAQDGDSLIYIALDRRLAGALRLAPRTRLEMDGVIARLRSQGVTYMAVVSGDAEAPTRKLAEELGLDGWFAGVLPQRKAEIVAMLQAEGRTVCFVGDGINDSVALRQADVSVSLAGANTVAKDMAEIVLMDGHVGALGELGDISAELDKNLRESLEMSIAPGVINLLGAFVFNFNTLASLVINGSFGFLGALHALPDRDDVPEPRGHLESLTEGVILHGNGHDVGGGPEGTGEGNGNAIQPK
jgi:Cu2+-exporting ATPase